MPGTPAGGQKAAAKNLARDPEFYSKIGRKGGQRGTTGGFAVKVDCACAVIPTPHFIRNCAGYKGGTTSRRGKKVSDVTTREA